MPVTRCVTFCNVDCNEAAMRATTGALASRLLFSRLTHGRMQSDSRDRACAHRLSAAVSHAHGAHAWILRAQCPDSSLSCAHCRANRRQKFERVGAGILVHDLCSPATPTEQDQGQVKLSEPRTSVLRQFDCNHDKALRSLRSERRVIRRTSKRRMLKRGHIAQQ